MDSHLINHLIMSNQVQFAVNVTGPWLEPLPTSRPILVRSLLVPPMIENTLATFNANANLSLVDPLAAGDNDDDDEDIHPEVVTCHALVIHPKLRLLFLQPKSPKKGTASGSSDLAGSPCSFLRQAGSSS